MTNTQHLRDLSDFLGVSYTQSHVTNQDINIIMYSYSVLETELQKLLELLGVAYCRVKIYHDYFQKKLPSLELC